MIDGDCRVVTVAASVGGVEALKTIFDGLPGDFPAAVLVVQHHASASRSILADILGRHTPLRVREAEDGDEVVPGTVYLAPPDQHLVVDAEGILRLSAAQKVRYVRPAADPLFESASVVFGDRVVAIVLTGGGCDGADGVRYVRKAGGVVIAQNEATSQVFGMPHQAIETGCVDEVLPLQEIAGRLVALAGKGHRETV